jgi:hypothetical protein
MQHFRTVFDIEPSKNKINYTTKILSLGSCFSENIGDKLLYYKLPVNINPFGILYNPESVANSIDILLQNKQFTDADIFEHNGIWNSFFHHSCFSDVDKENCLQKINTSITVAANHLKNTRFLLITFGTAWVYEYKKNRQIVSNCHKIPAKEFIRYRLSQEYIVERFSNTIKTLLQQNKNINIVFTVSPVRHFKDGAHENQLSKSTLLLAIDKLKHKFENIEYFPSYEIVMDDLRDYRFYADDMLHPSPQAVEYIWNKFKDAFTDKQTNIFFKQIEDIHKALQHKSFQPESEAHQKFLKSTYQKTEMLEKQIKSINFTKEKNILKNNMFY